MSKGNEGKLIDKIHRQTDKYKQANRCVIYHVKMNMAPGSPSGFPDVMYEANPNNMWVEYKHVGETWVGKRKIPVSKITPNQINWLRRAVSNKQDCAVVFGASDGQCIILRGESIFTPPEIQTVKLLSPNQIAKIIALVTMKQNFKELK